MCKQPLKQQHRRSATGVQHALQCLITSYKSSDKTNLESLHHVESGENHNSIPADNCDLKITSSARMLVTFYMLWPWIAGIQSNWVMTVRSEDSEDQCHSVSCNRVLYSVQTTADFCRLLQTFTDFCRFLYNVDLLVRVIKGQQFVSP
jgi:hypothetical protein